MVALPPPEPFSSRNHRNLSLLFLRMPMKGQPLTRGKRAASIQWSEANDFRTFMQGDYVSLTEDYELTRFEFEYRIGWRKGEELWALGSIVNRGGGFMDGLITGWHRLVLGWTDPVRDATPNGLSSLYQANKYDVGPTFGLGDVSIGWTKSLGPATTVSAAVKLPVGDRGKLLGSGGVDVGASIDHTFTLNRRWFLHAQLGLVVQGDASRVGGTRSLIDQESFALMYRPNSRDTYVGQWQSERAPVTTDERGANATHRLLTLAYRRSLSHRDTLELWFSEDRDVFNGAWPEAANLGPDITIGIRYSWRF